MKKWKAGRQPSSLAIRIALALMSGFVEDVRQRIHGGSAHLTVRSGDSERFRDAGYRTAAVIAGFPAREVVVAVMGTIYAVGEEAEEASLTGKLRSATWPDGSLVFTLPMVLGLLIFYAWCLQCAATIAVIRRETNSWRWPAFAWTYMTVLGYSGAFLVYQLGSLAH